MPESEIFWDQLLGFVQDGTVVPVIGRGLLNFDLEGHPHSLYPYLAGLLADYLGFGEQERPEPLTLDEVTCRYLERGGSRRDAVYSALKQLMPASDELPVPEPLAKLADISRLSLFISTTFDPLLERALSAARGKGVAHVIAYSPERPADLSSDWDASLSPIVFHLLGQLSTEPYFAVTEEDTLEFVHSLQSEEHRPQRLLDRLYESHLLILGSNFDDWLARFFLRSTMRERLSRAQGLDYWADRSVARDAELVRFLERFGSRIRIVDCEGPTEFVDELHRRWRERHPDGEEAERPAEDAPRLRSGTVFLSYAREDGEIAAAIRKALNRAGMDVWLDKKQLEWGDDWDWKIRKCLERCALFLPVLSRHTLTDERRYFRIEWDLAATEAKKGKKSTRFVLPILVDDTPPDHPDFPKAFSAAQAKRLSWADGGEELEELAATCRQLVRDHERRARRRQA